MRSTLNALFIGAKVTEFETSQYLKVFIAGVPDDDDTNIYGLDLMICAADMSQISHYEKLQPQKQYTFITKVQSGSKNRIALKILGIKEVQAAKG